MRYMCSQKESKKIAGHEMDLLEDKSDRSPDFVTGLETQLCLDSTVVGGGLPEPFDVPHHTR